MIGYGMEVYSDGVVEVRCPLVERGWYHIPADFTGAFDSSASVESLRKTLKPVTRKEFMLVLGELDRLLVRAKFSRRQMESR